MQTYKNKIFLNHVMGNSVRELSQRKSVKQKSLKSMPNKRKGLLIVIEGTDGSGKATQVDLLFKCLKKEKTPCATFSFPDYTSKAGKTIASYLRGDHGSLQQIDPYFFASLYADDRKAKQNAISQALQQGKIVILDRYVSSNFYQMAKLPSGQSQKEFRDWLFDLEYCTNHLPTEDLVIFLSMPPTISSTLLRSRKPKFDQGKMKKDIHEQNKSYMQKVFATFQKEAKENPIWHIITCTKQGRLLPPEHIHQEIYDVVSSKILKRKIG